MKGTTPTPTETERARGPTETERARAVLGLEEELQKAGKKNKHAIEKEYKAALIALNHELDKKPKKTGAVANPLELDKEDFIEKIWPILKGSIRLLCMIFIYLTR